MRNWERVRYGHNTVILSGQDKRPQTQTFHSGLRGKKLSFYDLNNFEVLSHTSLIRLSVLRL